MHIHLIKEPFSHVIIQNTFSKQDYDLVWNELLYLQPRMKTPEQTGSSKNQYGRSNKRGVGLFLYDFFVHPTSSDIYNCTRKIINPSLVEATRQLDPYFKLFDRMSNDIVLVQCYKNGDYYLPHNDNFIFTMVTELCNMPKKYSGGELYFKEYDYTIALENNSSIMFPAVIIHEIKEIKTDSTNPQDFRYTISQFLENYSRELTTQNEMK